MAEERKIIAWYSLKGGKHIPVYEGESKKDAIDRALGEKDKAKASPKTAKIDFKGGSQDKQKEDIAKNQETAKKLNDESKYRDELSKGNNVSIMNGKMTFKGKEVDSIDLSERGTPGKDSLADHVTDKGQLSPERQEVHRQIIEDYFKGHQPYAPGEEKVAMFTGGGGASGKGAFSKDIGKFYSQNKKPLVIDPDEIKKSLAKADGREMNDKLTGYYHEESSALAKQIYSTSLKNNYPTFYDGTATGGGIYKLLDSAKKNGYKTEMSFVYSDWKTVRMNSLDRYRATNRLVPITHLTGAHQKAFESVEKLQDKVDSFKLYDNAGRNLKLVGSQTGGKKLTIHDSASYERFSKSKAEFTLSTDEIQAYNRDVAKINREKANKQA